jgi:hypothetical protein
MLAIEGLQIFTFQAELLHWLPFLSVFQMDVIANFSFLAF